jgi:hypothetical protein
MLLACVLHHILRIVLHGMLLACVLHHIVLNGVLLVLLRRIARSLLVSDSGCVATVLLGTVRVSVLKGFLVIVFSVNRLLHTCLFSVFDNIFVRSIGLRFLFVRKSTLINLLIILVCIFRVDKRRRLRKWAVVVETSVVRFHSGFE